MALSARAMRGPRGAGTYVQVQGLRELSKMLGQAPIEIERDYKKELKRISEPVRSSIAGRVPRGNNSQPGVIANSIQLRATRRGVKVGSPLAYAGILEFGKTSAGEVKQHTRSGYTVRAHKRNYSSLTAKYGAPARFMIPVVSGYAPKIVNEVEDVVNRTFEKLFDGKVY